MKKNGYVYILANKRNGTLYTGVTSSLSRRIENHKNASNPKCFTAKYKVDQLVYLEQYNSIEVAIKREKQIKAGNRKKKLELIEKSNPEWKDLSYSIELNL